MKYKIISNMELSLFNMKTFNKFMNNGNYYNSLEYYEDSFFFNLGTYGQQSTVDLYLLRLCEEIQRKVYYKV